MRRILLLASLVTLGASNPAQDPLAVSAQQKLDLIDSGKAKPGSTIVFSLKELNAWGRSKVPSIAPEGVREPRLELGNGTATAYMLVDLLKIRHGQGVETNWFISKLIEGERPLKVIARIESAHGKATVRLLRVEISGVAVFGTTLDFLIQNFFRPLYPDAHINEPFELQSTIDHIEVHPTEARAIIKR